MFTIDLLKGAGLPEKGKARNMALAAAASAVPLVAAIAMFSVYLQGEIDISIQSGKIARWKASTDTLSDAVARQKELEREKALYGAYTAEVEDAMGRHTQWSPILATVASNMPESVVLTALEVKKHAVRMKVTTKEDPEKTRDVSVPVPTLRMNLAATPQPDGDKDVKDFRSRLLASALLGSRLEDITVSQKADKLNGLEVVSYEINCLFKPKL